MNVLVLGGTGVISRAIVNRLLDKGHEVTIYNRPFKVYGIGRKEITLTPMATPPLDLYAMKGDEVVLAGIKFKVRGVGKKLVLRVFSKKELKDRDPAAEQKS